MIEKCKSCKYRHITPKGANWCDELDMRLHPNPAHGDCRLYEVKPLINENDGR